MHIEEAKIYLKREYRQGLISLAMAKKVADKIEPLLPRGWNCSMFLGTWLSIEKTEEMVHASEFRVVCDLVEKVTGKKVERSARSEKMLKGEVWIKEKLNRYLHIEIYLADVDGCRIERKQETREVYVASPECLGIRQEEVR